MVTKDGLNEKFNMLTGTVIGNSCGGSTTGSAGRHIAGGVPQ
jgi:hypothetical protein